ncbi:iron-sulfur cluster repair di-iron protein [Flavobacterium cellulosilyticum]|uniref:Iron-sulfur cluster repair di-iron protein n=1 Tax=Flavobacterium cellulosilyticum TaxID=2541731 RepID=A0A4R5CBB0_9FLAO|nr:iron-sulfur cluster repair di-iron protein [Flavobacterium cellulosilyticum]TDD94394.1 iron-sulfur cluster repair di-iron protein [Flavobacterium cellulosilyticum]
MTLLETNTIGEYVAQDFRTAAIFTKYGIDFCCRGNRTLQEVCTKNELNESHLLAEINAVLTSKNDTGIDFNSWSLDLLIDYIEKTHHRYVEEKAPIIIQFLDKLCSVHGSNHPELFEVYELFKGSAGELALHMKKEELILFPFIRKMMGATKSHEAINQPQFGTVDNPIATMMDEHDNEGLRFRTIAALTNNYTLPEDACNTFKVTYAMLEEFEQDLHKHIHLENNIVFPKSKALEKFFSFEK